MTEWITITQASDLTQKSKITIRRLIKKNSIICEKKSGKWMIDQSSLSDLFILNNQNDQVINPKLNQDKVVHNQKKKVINSEIDQAIKSMHNQIDQVLSKNSKIDNSNLITVLKEQIEMLKNHVDEKDKQIAELHERIRELHVLLKQAHNQPKQLPATTGVFSRVLVKFGL